MKNDKQKVMILAALGVVMVGVGAFSFMGGSEPAAPPATTKKQEPEAETTSHSETETGTSETTPGTSPETSPETVVKIDPETGKPVTSPVGAEGGQAAEGTVPTAPPEINVLVDPEAVRVAQLSARDPFNGVRWDPMERIRPVSQPSNPTPPRTSTTRRPGSLGGKPITVPPFPVDGTDGLNPISGGGQIGTTPGGMPTIEEPPYKVNGIVRGANSAAIVTDGSGKQRIVRVGSNLDPDTKVLGVENGKMIVRYRGKIKTVSIDEAGANQKEGNKPPQNQ